MVCQRRSRAFDVFEETHRSIGGEKARRSSRPLSFSAITRFFLVPCPILTPHSRTLDTSALFVCLKSPNCRPTTAPETSSELFLEKEREENAPVVASAAAATRGALGIAMMPSTSSRRPRHTPLRPTSSSSPARASGARNPGRRRPRERAWSGGASHGAALLPSSSRAARATAA